MKTKHSVVMLHCWQIWPINACTLWPFIYRVSHKKVDILWPSISRLFFEQMTSFFGGILVSLSENKSHKNFDFRSFISSYGGHTHFSKILKFSKTHQFLVIIFSSQNLVDSENFVHVTQNLSKIQPCKRHENAQSRACYMIGSADQVISP